MFSHFYHVTCQRVLWNRTFLYIYLSTSFGVRKFKNTFKLWGSSFFWKCSKLNLILENAKTNSANIFPFWDNWIWKCSYKVSRLKRKYLSYAINALTNSPKNFHIIQTDFFQLSCLYTDQQILERCDRSDFKSVSARLPCHLSKGPLKWEFLDIYLTTYSGVRKFKNTSTMKVMLFWKIFKIKSKFSKLRKKFTEYFWFFR